MNRFGVLDTAASRFLPKLSPTLANFDAGSQDSKTVEILLNWLEQ